MTIEEVGAKRLGTTIREKWVLEQLLGVGGMASVYVGRHKIGRREAIKILHSDIAQSEQIRARFEQEARAVNSFRHPGVVEVRDVDVTEDGAPFLVMELLDGESLSARVRREPPLPASEVLRIAQDVLDVLAAAHERQIIHRDIKPDNLFLLRDGRIKVLDFGIARVRTGLGVETRTQAGVTLGTMAYMPPEQARGQEIDGRADLYAVGATMFRVLTGRIVHDAATDAELVMKALSEPAPRLASVAPGVPPPICDVVDRALAFAASDRYPTAATMRDDIAAVREGKPPPYASNAPPLPEPIPSSFSFRGGSSARSAARDDPTVAPRAKQPAATAPRNAAPVPAPRAPASPAASVPGSGTGTQQPQAAVQPPTRVGEAAEVAPTRAVAAAVIPPSAVRSGKGSPPAALAAPLAAPVQGSSAAGYGPSPVAAPTASASSRSAVFLLIGAAALLLFLLVATALLLVTLRPTTSADEGAEPPASPGAAPTRTAAAPPWGKPERKDDRKGKSRDKDRKKDKLDD